MRLLLTVALLLTLSVLFSAEIKDGQLFLDIYILDGKQITINPQGNFTISEISSPISRQYKDKITLQLSAADEQPMWGIVNKSEIIKPDSTEFYLDENIREKFVWQDSRLIIRYEKLTFEDEYFPSKDAASGYAAETGYPKKQIRSIPMQNAGLKVTQPDGTVHFFQLPVKLSCKNGISLNSNADIYQGMFIIRPGYGKLVITNLQDIENYVAGVVPNEIGNNAPQEALKAQAVAARTHAVSLLLYNRHSDDGYDLCNGTHCQVYKGNHLRGEEVDKAVLETKGVVMLYDNKIADGVYCSSCGGKTESNQNAWSGNPIPYLQGVSCYPELDSLDLTLESDAVQCINTKISTSDMASWEKRSEMWDRTITRTQLAANSGVSGLQSLEVIKRGFSGRIIKLRLIGDSTLLLDNEWKIRQQFGGLPSSFFYITNSKNHDGKTYSLPETINIKGKGSGHGVGLCQVGALQKARQGWNWDAILSHYYPGITLGTDWLQTDKLKHDTNTTD